MTFTAFTWESSDDTEVCLTPAAKEKMNPKIRAYNDAPALVSSAQLRVGGVLHIEHPAAHQHCQPCQEQVLHTHEGDPSLSSSERNKLIKPTCSAEQWRVTTGIQISKTNKRRPKSLWATQKLFVPCLEVSHSVQAELWRIKWFWFPLWSHGRNSLCCVYFSSVQLLTIRALQHFCKSQPSMVLARRGRNIKLPQRSK